MRFKKYIKSIPSLTLIGMLLFTGIFITSCKEEEEEFTQVVLNSFGPTGVNHGEQIKFIGLNLDKVTSIILPGVEVSKSQFVTQTSKLIEIVVPEEAVAGKVTLKTPEGDLVSKSMLSFNVPVVIESVTAEARPGANITIKGKMVNWIEEVAFSEELAVTEFVSQSLTELVVKVPMEAQTGFLIFKNGGTKPLSFASEEELVVTLPVVTSFSPASIKHTEDLTISGTDLDLITSIIFEGDKTVTAFESQSATQIVVKVPAETLKGKLILKQASPIDVVTNSELTIILPIGTNITPVPATPGTDDITIKGTDLNLIATLTLQGITTPIPASSFKSHSATEIVLALPEEAKSGGIKYTTIHGYSNNLGVNVVLPGPGPKPLAITMYDDEIFFGGQDWSWGQSLSDPANTEQAHAGTMSWKHVTSGGDGGAKAGNMTGLDVSSLGVFVFSLYGGTGTDGKQVAAILRSDGNDIWGSYNSVTLVEGEWTEYRLELSKYSAVNLTNISGFIFKVEGATDAILYVDRVGFDPGGPTALDHYIFDDAPQNGFGTWGGWGGASFDATSTENPRTGTVSIKATYGGDWGGASQFGGGNLSTAGLTHFVFSIFGGDGTDGKNIRVIVKSSDGEANKDIAIVEGEWTEVQIPLSELGNPENVTEIAFQDTEFSGIVFIDRIGLQ